jgi:NADPH-dependent curcumin reductase CurA
MRQRVNRQVRLKSRPSGIPQAEHFELVEAPVPDPSDGQVLVRNMLSVDPAMRGRVSTVANYSEPVALGAVTRSLAVGRVEASRNSDFHPGEYVTGMFGWQDFAVVAAEAIERKVDGSGLPISTFARRRSLLNYRVVSIPEQVAPLFRARELVDPHWLLEIADCALTEIP